MLFRTRLYSRVNENEFLWPKKKNLAQVLQFCCFEQLGTYLLIWQFYWHNLNIIVIVVDIKARIDGDETDEQNRSNQILCLFFFPRIFVWSFDFQGFPNFDIPFKNSANLCTPWLRGTPRFSPVTRQTLLFPIASSPASLNIRGQLRFFNLKLNHHFIRKILRLLQDLGFKNLNWTPTYIAGHGYGSSRNLQALHLFSTDHIDVDHRHRQWFAPIQDHGVFVVEGDGDRKIQGVEHVHSWRVRMGNILLS